EDDGEIFLGRSVTRHKQVSDVTAHAIDEEVRNLIDTAYTEAKDLLQQNEDKLHMMAQALIKYETIDEQQIRDIMGGRAPRPPEDWDEPSQPNATTAEPEDQPAPAFRPTGQPGPAGQH